jgi:hypothetical protein
MSFQKKYASKYMNNIKEELQSIKALTNNDISDFLGKHGLNVSYIPYHMIHEFERLNDVPLPWILLYELHHPVGHWVAVFMNHEGLNYFDPLGYKPDQLLIKHFMNPFGRELMGADETYLLKLMVNDFKFVTYNEKRLQQLKSKTCGYWCAIRLLCADISQDNFAKEFMKYNGDARDMLIVKLYHELDS